MALINRITRLFRADFHAVLDRIEEPDILLKQAVREMEDDQASDEQKLKLVTHELAQIEQRQSEISLVLEQAEDELNICFISEKEDLARSIIKRKLETQRFLSLLNRKHKTLSESSTELKTRIEHNRTRLQAMQQKLDLFADDNATSSYDEYGFTADFSVTDDEIEVAFLREKQQRTLL